MILGYFLAVTRLPTELSNLITNARVNPYIIWLMVFIMYLFLGCILDSLAMVLLTVPIIFPAMMALGFDPIWLAS